MQVDLVVASFIDDDTWVAAEKKLLESRDPVFLREGQRSIGLDEPASQPLMMALEGRYRFTRQQVRTFVEELCAKLEECAECEESVDGETYLLTAVLFPLKDSATSPERPGPGQGETGQSVA